MSTDLIRRLRDALEFHYGFVRNIKYENGEPLFMPSASGTALIAEADAHLAKMEGYVLVRVEQLKNLAYYSNFTATPKQFAEHLQREARIMLAAAQEIK